MEFNGESDACTSLGLDLWDYRFEFSPYRVAEFFRHFRLRQFFEQNAAFAGRCFSGMVLRSNCGIRCGDRWGHLGSGFFGYPNPFDGI